MRGRVCVVTGATAGLGKVSARCLAERGATVILVARSRPRGEAAVAEIRSRTGNPRVSLALGDLSSQASVAALAARLRAEHPAIHVLLNNAGGIFDARALTVDGLETTFATNHLGPFLLTRLLLDRLIAGAPARIVTVGSEMHRFGTLCWDDLQHRRGYSPLRAYNASKLANVAFTFALARRLPRAAVTATCVHPGVVASSLGGSGSRAFQDWMRVYRPLLIDEEEGARAQVELCCDEALTGVTGRYFNRQRRVAASDEARDPEVAERLWDESCALTGLDA